MACRISLFITLHPAKNYTRSVGQSCYEGGLRGAIAPGRDRARINPLTTIGARGGGEADSDGPSPSVGPLIHPSAYRAGGGQPAPKVSPMDER